MTANSPTKDQQAVVQALQAVTNAADDPEFQVSLYKQLTAQAPKINLDGMSAIELGYTNVKSPEVRDAFIEFLNTVGVTTPENATVTLKAIKTALDAACKKQDLDAADKPHYGRLLKTAGAIFVKFPQHLDTEYARIHIGEHHMPRHILLEDDLNAYVKLYRRATLARLQLVGSELTATPAPAESATPVAAPSAPRR